MENTFNLSQKEIQDLINHGFATVNGVPLSTLLTWESCVAIWNRACDMADAEKTQTAAEMHLTN